ncbi:flavin reductase [Capnocytophaga sp. HP1101]
MSIQAVETQKVHRLFNVGPTTMVSAKHDGVANVMSVAWVTPLEYDRLMLIISYENFTRKLIEKNGYFAVQVPVAQQAELVLKVGTISKNDHPDKIDNVPLFYQEGYDVPLVEGCAAWVICKLIDEPEVREKYDLVMGQVVAAWSDDRIFRKGHYEFDEVPDELRTLHYVAGGQFYTIGKGMKFDKGLELP